MTNNQEESFVKGMSLMGFGRDGNPSIVDVKDGNLLRIRPLHYDWQYNMDDLNPWKMEVRGHILEPTNKTLLPPFAFGYKKRVYSPNRILYPLKRVDWDPNGERHPENRGSSRFVRISWEEAVDLVASELLRVKETYGPEAVLSQSDGHGEGKGIHSCHGSFNKLLQLLGGFTLQIRNTDSWEGWAWGAKHAWGMEPVGEMLPDANLMPDIAENTQMLLFWGCDPETTPWGFNGQMASRVCYWFSELGIKCVYICPDLNYGAAVHADKWIPIKPGTDAALQLAIAYTWITEGTYDKDYVATHTYGFDKFEEYVTGEEDGIAKTADWAAGITSIPPFTIKALAREWASKKTSIAHGNGGPTVRGPYSTEPARLEVLLLAMQGLGKPGVHQVKMLEWGLGQGPMPEGVVTPKQSMELAPEHFSIGAEGTPFVQMPGMRMTRNVPPPTDTPPPAPMGMTAKQIIPKNLIHEAILNPPISWYGNGRFMSPSDDHFTKYTYPAKGCSEVHMIWTDTPCWITCWNDSNSYIRALRSPKIETIIGQNPWLENDCLFADIILPSSTKIEEKDITADPESGQFNTIMSGGQCIEPLGESKSTYEIACMVSEKLGMLDDYTDGKTVDDLLRMNFEKTGISEMISYEEFEKKKYFTIPTAPDWKDEPPGMKRFYEDPDNNPLSVPSGKIEFSSQNLAKHFADDRERPPVPHWIEKGESHDERQSSERAQTYPLLMMSNHPRWRVHSQCDEITWTREAPTCKVEGPDGYNYEPLWINPGDAPSRGVKTGDVVRVYNERGVVLGGAYVTERIMPGVVYMDHGARYDPIVPGEIDRGGAINTITPHNITSKNATGMVVSSFLVEVAKEDLDELRKNYPEAFKREYDPAAGLEFTAWVKKENSR
jgi:anaerobic selenocysteine-containing dehydrogenase